MRRWSAAALFVVAACSPVLETSVDQPEPTPMDQPEPAPVDSELDIIVEPDPDGALPSETLVSCSGGPTFPVSALDSIQPLDSNHPGGAMEALQSFLTNEEGQHWPQENWRILHSTDSEMTLVNLTEDGQLSTQHLAAEDGVWRWNGSAIHGDPCDLEFAIPEDLNTVEWVIDSSQPPPSPNSQLVHVLLQERECVSGQEIGDRLIGPQVVETESTVSIAFAATPPPGEFQTCQGNPQTPFTVELAEPLGDRTINPDRQIGLSLEDYLD